MHTILNNVDPLGPRFVYDIFMYLPAFHEEDFNDYHAFTHLLARSLIQHALNCKTSSWLKSKFLLRQIGHYYVFRVGKISTLNILFILAMSHVMHARYVGFSIIAQTSRRNVLSYTVSSNSAKLHLPRNPRSTRN